MKPDSRLSGIGMGTVLVHKIKPLLRPTVILPHHPLKCQRLLPRRFINKRHRRAGTNLIVRDFKIHFRRFDNFNHRLDNPLRTLRTSGTHGQRDLISSRFIIDNHRHPVKRNRLSFESPDISHVLITIQILPAICIVLNVKRISGATGALNKETDFGRNNHRRTIGRRRSSQGRGTFISDIQIHTDGTGFRLENMLKNTPHVHHLLLRHIPGPVPVQNQLISRSRTLLVIIDDLNHRFLPLAHPHVRHFQCHIRLIQPQHIVSARQNLAPIGRPPRKYQFIHLKTIIPVFHRPSPVPNLHRTAVSPIHGVHPAGQARVGRLVENLQFLPFHRIAIA